MQAVFRFNGSEEVVVSNQVGGVLLEVLRGDARPGFGSSDGEKPGDRTLLSLSKSEARAVASALMGAAAEL